MSLPRSEGATGSWVHEEEIERKRALLARVKTTRDAVLLNRGKVEGDPTKEYVWVNIREDRQVWYRSQGFTLCRDPNVITQYRREDGTHVRGDLILYEVDKEYFDALHDFNVARGIEYLEGAEDNFETSAMRDGVPVFKPKIQ